MFKKIMKDLVLMSLGFAGAFFCTLGGIGVYMFMTIGTLSY